MELLRRTTRKVTLTIAGQEFFDSCSKGLVDISEAEERIRGSRGAPQGTLRVQLPQAFGRLHVAPHIPEFLKRYPEIHLDLHFGPADFEGSQAFDVVVASTDPPHQGLAVRALAPLERVTCASSSYLQRFGRPQRFADLAKHNCLLFGPDDTKDAEWVLHEERSIKRVRVSGSLRTDEAEVLYLAVIAGVGIAHLPTFVVERALSTGDLVALFRDRRGRTGAAMNAYFPQAHHRLAKVQVFIEFLASTMRKRRRVANSKTS